MSDENTSTKTTPSGRGRGGRKASAASTHPAASETKCVSDQGLGAGEAPQALSQALAPVPFDFQGKAVRTITQNGEVWFVAADVCGVLELGNPRQAISRLDDDERGVLNMDTPGGPQDMSSVSESGLFSLVFTSHKPEAKAFRRWVTGVVLPTLRRTGTFNMADNPIPTEGLGDGRDWGTRNSINVALPGPGRYLLVLFHDGERRIEKLSFSDSISALAALDCRAIAYTHLTAAALWEKLQHMASLTPGLREGFAFDKLTATMQAGADLARQVLYTFDEPMLIHRGAVEAPAQVKPQ
jgi:hypothetical protein